LTGSAGRGRTGIRETRTGERLAGAGIKALGNRTLGPLTLTEDNADGYLAAFDHSFIQLEGGSHVSLVIEGDKAVATRAAVAAEGYAGFLGVMSCEECVELCISLAEREVGHKQGGLGWLSGVLLDLTWLLGLSGSESGNGCGE
jgi:hypothetical protein